MRVLALSRYEHSGASSRYRMWQYLPYLKNAGIDVTMLPLLDDGYIAGLSRGARPRPANIASSYLKRIYHLIAHSRRYDLIWLQIEAFPWAPALLENLFLGSGLPYVVDYDDAWFHRYDMHNSRTVRTILGTKIDSVMRGARMVIAGNSYLAQRAKTAGASWIEILPTVLGLDRYPTTEPTTRPTAPFIVGWIGSPSTTPYLKLLEPALTTFSRRHSIVLTTIGASELDLGEIPHRRLPWTEAGEVEYMRQFDVGIMPLPNTPWELGKCGFKLIQYMACCLPVIASPVGVNPQIVQAPRAGYIADSGEEWVSALERMSGDPVLRQSMGAEGRRIVETQYSLNVAAPKLIELLVKASQSSGR